MKTLIIISLITIGALQSNAACDITLYKKKAGAKTSYTKSGASISKKVIEKLSGQCKFTTEIMSAAEVKVLKIARLRAQLAKLNK